MTLGFLWFELNYPTGSGRFEIIIVQEHSSFLDFTIPCLKIVTYNNTQPIIAYICSFGIPIDSETIIIGTNLENSTIIVPEERNGQSTDVSAGLQKNSNEKSMQAIEAFNLAETTCLILATILSLLFLFAPHHPWAASIIFAIGLAGMIALYLYFSLIEVSYEVKRGYLAGFSVGLFGIGVMFLAPIPKPGLFWDIIRFMGCLIVTRLLYNWFFPDLYPFIPMPEIPVEIPTLPPWISQEETYDSIQLLTLSIGVGFFVSFVYNYKVEHHYDLKAAWLTLGGLYLGFGLALMLIIKGSE